jgi:hypothetical protein
MFFIMLFAILNINMQKEIFVQFAYMHETLLTSSSD